MHARPALGADPAGDEAGNDNNVAALEQPDLLPDLEHLGDALVADSKAGMLRHGDGAAKDLAIEVAGGRRNRPHDRLQIALNGKVRPLLPLELVPAAAQKD